MASCVPLPLGSPLLAVRHRPAEALCKGSAAPAGSRPSGLHPAPALCGQTLQPVMPACPSVAQHLEMTMLLSWLFLASSLCSWGCPHWERRPCVDSGMAPQCQHAGPCFLADSKELYAAAGPERENLCLYGHPDGNWSVDLPTEEVPPELPEPVLGINFARDGGWPVVPGLAGNGKWSAVGPEAEGRRRTCAHSRVLFIPSRTAQSCRYWL